MEYSIMDQQQYIFGSILLLGNKLQSMRNDLFEDMTLKQFILLIMISKMDKPSPSVQEIADYAGSTRQNVKKMLEILEREEYVTIKKSIEDKRSFCVTLTELCIRYFEQHKDAAEKITNVLFHGMEDRDIASTYKVINILFENIEKINNTEGITL